MNLNLKSWYWLCFIKVLVEVVSFIDLLYSVFELENIYKLNKITTGIYSAGWFLTIVLSWSSKLFKSSILTLKKYCPLLALFCNYSLKMWLSYEFLPVDESWFFLNLKDEMHKFKFCLIFLNDLFISIVVSETLVICN